MSSPAALKYIATVERIQTLRKTATDRRLRPMSLDEIQVYYHAALAGDVAAWNAYIKNVVNDFYDVIPNSSPIYVIAQQAAQRSMERFNTPNWEKAQRFLEECTGYDPINDWVWGRRGMSGLQVRVRLNEILQVRHSFAHGFDIPAYNWTELPSGRIRLTSKAIQETEAFFKNLVKVTDRGMKAHIESTYGLSNIW